MFLNAWCGTLKIHVTFCLLLSWFSLQMGKELNDTYSSVIDWVSDPNFNDVVIHLNQTASPQPWWDIFQQDNLSISASICAEKCIQDPLCSSFFVDIQKNRCILHEIIFLSADAGNRTETSHGARYFRRSEDLCSSSEGFYRWRSDGLCFKFVLNVSLQTSDDIGISYCKEVVKGNLLQYKFDTRFLWLLKVLMQLPAKYYNLVPFSDKILRPHWCEISQKGDKQRVQQVGFNETCLFIGNTNPLKDEETYNIFCEVF